MPKNLNDYWYGALSSNGGESLTVDSVPLVWQLPLTGAVSDAWDVVTSGGVTASLSSGVLTVASGTTAGGYAELLSKQVFNFPARLMSILQSGATRQANTHHYVEFVQVDDFGAISEVGSCGWDIGGSVSTTVTLASFEVQSSGLRPQVSAASTVTTTAGGAVFEIEPSLDEVGFYTRVGESLGSGRAASYVKQQQIPDAAGNYKLRIRSMNHAAWKSVGGAVAGTGNVIRLTVTTHGYATSNVVWVEALNGVTDNGNRVRGNYTVTVVDANTIELQGTVFGGTYVSGSGRVALAAAPAASVNFQFLSLTVLESNELAVEVTGGRGSSLAGQAIPVAMATALPAGTAIIGGLAENIMYADSSTVLAASATFTGTARDTGAGLTGARTTVNGYAFSDVAGTIRIEQSTDNVTWRRTTADTAVAANSFAFVVCPIVMRYWRVVYVNGAAAQTAFTITSSFTSA